MNRIACLAFLAGLLGLAGCQSASGPATPFAAAKLDKRRSLEITPADEEFGRSRAAGGDDKPGPTRRDPAKLTAGDLYQLPKFTVKKQGFRRLGLSVVTNTEVALGGPIEWMQVGVVLPGSPAARQRLFTGIDILAIDGVPIANLSREDMLHVLFERDPGEHVRLLVYSRQLGPLPMFITL